MVLIYSTTAVNANQLLFDVAKFNFSSFMVRDFDLEQLQFDHLGLIVISGFANQAEVLHYRDVMEKPGALRLPAGVVPLIISKHNFDILLDQGRDMNEYFEAAGDKRLEQIHQSVLPPDEYPSADEMYERSPETSKRDAETQPATAIPTGNQPTQKPTQQPAPEEPWEYDIPVPPVPTGRPPVPPRTDVPGSNGKQYRQLPAYPTGSEGDDPLLD